jgi:hypothetical protein
MQCYIWMKVTKDKYEYPVAIADTAGQLAIKCGVTAECIRSAIYHSKKTGYKSIYKKVKIDGKID